MVTAAGCRIQDGCLSLSRDAALSSLLIIWARWHLCDVGSQQREGQQQVDSRGGDAAGSPQGGLRHLSQRHHLLLARRGAIARLLPRLCNQR